jgi:TRAP-type C4-dicarboxylate transport system substrate-binding protein
MKLRLFAPVLAGALAASALAQAQTFDFALFHPERNAWTPTLKWWADEVAKQTGGRVQFRLHFAGALVSQAETFKAVRDGAVPAGQIAAGTISGQIPAMGYLEAIGGLPGDPDKFVTAMAEARPVVADLMARQGVQYLWEQSSGALIVLCRDKHLKSAADWKGKKVRTAGRWQAEQIRAIGGAAVAMDPAEQYLALQNRTIDCALSINVLALSLKLHEVAPYITDLRLPVNVVLYIMNKGMYDKLSPADRAAAEKLGVEGEKRSAQVLAQSASEAADQMKAQKAQFYGLNDAEVAEFRKGIAPAFARMDAETGADGKRIADIVKKYW